MSRRLIRRVLRRHDERIYRDFARELRLAARGVVVKAAGNGVVPLQAEVAVRLGISRALEVA